MKTPIAYLLIVFLLFLHPKPASAITVYDPANHAQNILTTIQTYISNVNEAIMIANQILNLESLPDDIIDKFDNQLSELFSIMGTINGLMQDIASLQSKFEALYPEFHASHGLIPRHSLAAESTKWIEHTRQMMLGVAKTGAQVLKNLPKRKKQVEKLMADSQGAVGILQATQASTQINATISANLMELNAQLASYTQAHTAFLMELNGSVSAAKNRMNYVMEDWAKPYPGSPIKENPF